MWTVDNRTPYAAFGCIIIDKHGAKQWLVTVRGTFDVDPKGVCTPADEQPEPILAPEYRGEDGLSSLLHETDVVAEKPYVDVLVEGEAFAPKQKPVTAVNVGLRTPFFEKLLTIRGDRVYTRNFAGAIAPGDPLPFVRKPVIYERAYGGFDKTNPDPTKQKMFAPNPVGCGFVIDPATTIGTLAPNVSYAGKSPSENAPAGFGPLCSYWHPRLSFGGTYDAKWVESRKPLLPLDHSNEFYNCAPRDQQIRTAYLGGSKFSVVNMSENGAFTAEIPKVVLGMASHFGREVRHHRGTLKTVILEPGQARVTLVWQSTLACHHQINDLDLTTVEEKNVLN